RFVNVLPLMFVVKFAITSEIAVMAALVANEAVSAVKLLLLIFWVAVAVPVVVSTVMPCSVPDETPYVRAIVLLLIVLVKVPVGAMLAEVLYIPRSVPDVTPPAELVILLKEV